MNISELRKEYHRQISENIIRIRKIKGNEIPNFADKDSKTSVRIAQGIVNRLGFRTIVIPSNARRKEVNDIEIIEDVMDLEEFIGEPLNLEEGKAVKEQTAGVLFEKITIEFIEKSFALLQHLRPGNWLYSVNSKIHNFEQYHHLAEIAEAVKGNKTLSSTLGRDYIITPDIVVSRLPVNDAMINQNDEIVSNDSAIFTPFREKNFSNPLPILHASISCKWTLRSDRSQNARTEALNLIRNRKGHLPHVMAITAEPYLNRLASLTLGTGDLDCVYHFALHELIEAVRDGKVESEIDFLQMMIEGKRLRDISDLPFDLAV